MSPINRSLYPPNWQEISDRIRFDRAGGKCERCGAVHGSMGARDIGGTFRTLAEMTSLEPNIFYEQFPTLASRKLITVYLTTAHLSRDSKMDGEIDLAALCQACHLAYDRHDNWQRRRRNLLAALVRAGQMALGIREPKK